MLPDRFRLFMSSTFVDLEKERAAAIDMLRRMGVRVIAMEDFGSSPRQPVDECLGQVGGSDFFVLVVANRYGSIPHKNSLSIVNREYNEARRLGLPILVYLADRDAYPDTGPPDPRMVKFRTHLRGKHVFSTFTSPDNLAAKINADVAQELLQIANRLEADSLGPLVPKHKKIVSLIRSEKFGQARTLSQRLLRDNPYSPRGHFNHTCILSRQMAQTLDPRRQSNLATSAIARLNSALHYDFIQYLELFGKDSHKEDFDAEQRILDDEDLQPLFEFWPSLRDDIFNGFIDFQYDLGC